MSGGGGGVAKIRTFFHTITAYARRLRLAGAVASQVPLLGTLAASTREDATRVDARVRAVRLIVALLSAVEAGPATNRLTWAVGLNVAVLSAVEAAPATSRLARAVRLDVALLSAAEAASTTSRLAWAVRPVVAMLPTAEAASGSPALTVVGHHGSRAGSKARAEVFTRHNRRRPPGCGD